MFMEIKKSFRNIKVFPIGTRRFLLLGLVLTLVIMLPLFVWGLSTGNFDLRERAAIEELQVEPELASVSSPITYVDGFSSAVTVTFNNPYANDKDWIALARPKSAINSYVNWKSLADTQTLAKVKSGTVTFTGVASGTYEARYTPNSGCSSNVQTATVSSSSPKLLHQWSFNSVSDWGGIGTGDDPHVWDKWKLFNYSPSLPTPSVSSGSLFISGPISTNSIYLGYKDQMGIPGFSQLSTSRDTVVEVIMMSSGSTTSGEYPYNMKVQLFSGVFGAGLIGSRNADAIANAKGLRKFSVTFPSTEVGGKTLKSMKIYLYLGSSSGPIKNLQIDTIRVIAGQPPSPPPSPPNKQ